MLDSTNKNRLLFLRNEKKKNKRLRKKNQATHIIKVMLLL